MTQPQKGICAEPNLHAQYLLLNVIDDDSEAVRAKLRGQGSGPHGGGRARDAVVPGPVQG